MTDRKKMLFTIFSRLVVLAVCCACFLLLFSVDNPWLLVLSRTSVIVVFSFIIVYCFMTTIYGSFDIGKKSRGSIIVAMSFNVIFSDIVSYFFLCVMNYSVVNNYRFVLENPLLLFLTILSQILVIYLMTRVFEAIYYSLFKAQKAVLITGKGFDGSKSLKRLGIDKKQFDFKGIISYDDEKVYEKIDEVQAVFLYYLPTAERRQLIEYSYSHGKNLFFSCEATDLIYTGGKKVLFDDLLMEYEAKEMKSYSQRILKRGMDIVFSLFALAITSPILLITAIAIKAEDKGPVFYRQKRITVNGREFEILKIRSMRQEVGNVHKSVTSDDDRITKVGRFIRKYRIDELPQFVNVLKGDMSVVGPRPEMIENVKKYTEEIPEFVYRTRAKAGITGYAQIYGKYNTTPRDKLMLDLNYIENYSVLLDIKLVLLTLLVFFKADTSTEAFDSDKKDNE